MVRNHHVFAVSGKSAYQIRPQASFSEIEFQRLETSGEAARHQHHSLKTTWLCSWVEPGDIQPTEKWESSSIFNLACWFAYVQLSGGLVSWIICHKEITKQIVSFPAQRAPICKPLHSSLSYFSSVFFKNGQDTMLFTNHQQSLSSGESFRGMQWTMNTKDPWGSSVHLPKLAWETTKRPQ